MSRGGNEGSHDGALLEGVVGEAGAFTMTLDVLSGALVSALQSQGIGREAIERILMEDIHYLTTWKLQSTREPYDREAKAIVAFAFGYGRRSYTETVFPFDPKLHVPGTSNDALADVIAYKRKQHPFDKLPVFAEAPLAVALKNLGVSVECVAAKGENQGTGDVFAQMYRAGVDKFPSVLLVAHPLHQFRCFETIKQYVDRQEREMEVIVAQTPEFYDPNAATPWTQSQEAWIQREVGRRFQARMVREI